MKSDPQRLTKAFSQRSFFRKPLFRNYSVLYLDASHDYTFCCIEWKDNYSSLLLFPSKVPIQTWRVWRNPLSPRGARHHFKRDVNLPFSIIISHSSIKPFNFYLYRQSTKEQLDLYKGTVFSNLLFCYLGRYEYAQSEFSNQNGHVKVERNCSRNYFIR